VINVDGHQILRANNYDLESGEKSVWQQELGEEEDALLEVDSRRAKKAKQAPKPAVRKIQTEKGRQKKIRDAARTDHNQRIIADKHNKQARRDRFIAANWKLLKPFVEKEQQPAAKSSAKKSGSPVFLRKQPSCLSGVTMRDYQIAGVNWLIESYHNGVSAILGDEMGLGKTLQTIAFLGWLKYEANVPGPHLVIVPLSVLSNWINEFRRFLPQMKVVRLHSSDSAERERLKKQVILDFEQYDVLVTTYEMAKSPMMQHSLVRSIHWRYVVLDEGHMIKNEHAIISQTVRKMHFENTLLLTGTPLQNNLHELWSILNFLLPDLFQKSAKFDSCFDIQHAQKHSLNQALLLQVHAMLKLFMLRRIKADVEKSVPPKVETKVMCPLTSVQTFWYKRFLLKVSFKLAVHLRLLTVGFLLLYFPTNSMKDSDLLMEMELELDASTSGGGGGTVAAAGQPGAGAKKSEWKKLQMLYMQLRKVCNHPYLFEEADPGVTNEAIVQASGKLQVLDRMLFKLQAAGHRCVIFSQFTMVLDILDDYLNMRGFRFCRLDGSTNRVQRQVDINSFNAPNSPLFAFIMSTRAGGLGVNLQTADTVILYDSDWNPQADLQAMARVHRIGQTKVVHVYRLVTAGTVEERIVQRAEKKLFLDQVVNRDSIKESEANDDSAETGAGMDSSELLQTLKFGAHAICHSSGSRMSDEELDLLIDRKRDQPGAGGAGSAGGIGKTRAKGKGRIESGQQHSGSEFVNTGMAAVPVAARDFQVRRFMHGFAITYPLVCPSNARECSS
jgi:SWI/SNF-related matrix-associated actin-dependent regulator of chromatin subfamily A member 5